MSFSSQEEIQEILGRYEAPIGKSILSAWAAWLEIPETLRLSLSAVPRARANAIAAFAYSEFSRLESGNESIRLYEAHDTVCLVIEEKVFVRFKKLARDYLSSNYQTQRAKEFNGQLALDGIPTITRVDVGYILDKLTTRIEELAFVYRIRNTVAWKYPISIDSNIQPIATESSEDFDTGERVRVRAKRRDDDRSSDQLINSGDDKE